MNPKGYFSIIMNESLLFQVEDVAQSILEQSLGYLYLMEYFLKKLVLFESCRPDRRLTLVEFIIDG